VARWGLLGLAALTLLGVLFVVGQSRRDATPELGRRLDCIAGQPIEPGAALTCADVAACARVSTWDASPPIAATAVYVVTYQPASGPVLGNGAGGYVVVFDLADGGQRRVWVSPINNCRHAST
jgi:hypothetical protein